jgi:hypothetical protein
VWRIFRTNDTIIDPDRSPSPRRAQRRFGRFSEW